MDITLDARAPALGIILGMSELDCGVYIGADCTAASAVDNEWEQLGHSATVELHAPSLLPKV